MFKSSWSCAIRRVGAVSLCAFGLLPAARAAVLDTQLVASGLNQPLFATAPLADGRVFVAEKGGRIRVAQGGVVSDFLSIPVATSGEQGLLGLAFDPGFGSVGNAGYGRFFVNYIDVTTQDTVVASYRAASGNLAVADPSSRVEVLRVDQPDGRNNHKAGWIGFKPGDADSLYIATGDGGGANDPDNFAQSTGVLLGKMLRVDINRDDFAADTSRNYGIPVSNPYVGTPGARGEIFALGLRNPFRNSFDRANGNLWIGDVGQGAREEIDFMAAASSGGQNFGWRIREGDIRTPGIADPDPGNLVGPLLAYDRSFGASVTGGYVVREAGSPLFGRYVFGDFVSGRVWSIAADGRAQSMADAVEHTAELNAGAGGPLANISSFGDGAAGELYIVDFAGEVLRVTAAVPEPGTLVMTVIGVVVLLGRRRMARVRLDGTPER
jgi:glucose/arabinose dehydrogenase